MISAAFLTYIYMCVCVKLFFKNLWYIWRSRPHPQIEVFKMYVENLKYIRIMWHLILKVTQIQTVCLKAL